MFAVIGNPTFDRIRTPERSEEAIGGGITYAALTLLSLGEAVAVWGKGDPTILALLRDNGADVSHFQAGETCLFENIYEEGLRRQRATAGQALREEELPRSVSRGVVLYTPVLGELQGAQCSRRGARLSAVDLQGLMRRLTEDGSVTLRRDPQAWEAVRRCDVVKLDDVEAEALTGRKDPREALRELLKAANGMVLLTLAERGAFLGRGNEAWRIHPPAVRVLDATGAGDVALSSFVFALLRTEDPLHAARFSTCAASLSVEGFGLRGVPSPAQIQSRLAETNCEEVPLP